MLSLGLGLAVAVAVVVCIAVLIVLTLLGLRRYGITLPAFVLPGKPSTGEEKQEMEWDNCELNITVNPLDCEAGMDEEVDIYSADKKMTYTDITEDIDQSEDEEEEREKKAHSAETKELEWDDSILTY